MSNDRYVSPLSERYASREMQHTSFHRQKVQNLENSGSHWQTEKELGLNITDEQIEELKAHAEDINYDVAKEREKVVSHDVMSHVCIWRAVSESERNHPSGATSCYVGTIQRYDRNVRGFKAGENKNGQCDRRTGKICRCTEMSADTLHSHISAGSANFGRKRATLWLQEFEMDLEDLDYVPEV